MSAEIGYAADDHPKAKIFISYSRKDMAFADRLEAALKARGFEPLIDRAEIYAFEDWWQRIEALINRADTIVFILSPDAVASEIALKEVAHGAALNKRFAPIVCRRVEDAAVPEALRRLNFVFFDEPERFDASADQLATALTTDIGWVRHHTDYGEAARRWAAAGRANGLLLRSPALEEAEHWIASRPQGAPQPAAETQVFLAESRRGATRRRNVLTGSLAAGLVISLGLAGVASWQRGIAVEQRQIAEQQRKRAEDTLAAATKTANGLISELAHRFRDTTGVPVSLIKDILDRARALQEQLIRSGATPDLRRSQAVALDEIVQTLIDQGDAKGALDAARQSLQISQELAAADPGTVGPQRDLAAAYANLGDAQIAQGDLSDALDSYRADLGIAKRLADASLADADLQNMLAGVYAKVGYAQVLRRDLTEALEAFRAGLAITKRLAVAMPDNVAWQRDLAIAYGSVGVVQNLQGNRAEALKSLQASLDVFVRLASSNSGDADLQRDLSVSYNKLGETQEAQGDLAGALKSYKGGLEVVEGLAKSDPGNATWQSDLVTSLMYVGDVAEAPEARAALARALTIADALAHDGKLNAQQQNWPQEIRDRLAKLPP